MRRFPTLLPLLLATLTLAAPPGQAPPLDLNRADAQSIDALPGVSTKLAEAIVRFREVHGPFADLEDVRQVPGMKPKLWEKLKGQVAVLPATPPPAPAGPAEPPPAQGIVAIANYFVEFRGVDLNALPPEIRQDFLETVNREECSCGCVGDTIARCYVNDPNCAVAKARLHALYQQSLEKAQAKP